MAEDDWDGWAALTAKLGGKVQLVGDDLFVNNPKRIKDGDRAGHANAILVQGQPDRHADRDARGGEHGEPRDLWRSHVASLGRDRGFDHFRPCGRHKLRSDQDRFAGAVDRLAKYNSCFALRRCWAPVRSMPAARS